MLPQKTIDNQADQIETLRRGDKERWLLVRGQDVTASQVGALFDVHPYASRFELYHQKRGSLRHEPRRGETPAMRRGRMFERVAVDWIKDDHPDWTVEYNAADFTYYRDPAARLGATPDLIVHTPERGWGVIQIKTTGATAFRKDWINEDGEEEAPLWIMLQAELERYVTGGTWAAVAALTVDDWFDAQLHMLEVPEVPGLIDVMKARSLAFWQDIEDGREPPVDTERDADLLDRLHPHADDEHEIDLTSDERAADLLARRADATAQRREADREIGRIDAEIKNIMGDAAVAHVGGGRRIKWRNERRSGRFTPPTNGRVLRVPQTTET